MTRGIHIARVGLRTLLLSAALALSSAPLALAAANLLVTMSGPSSVNVGDVVTYNLTVTNAGDAGSGSVSLNYSGFSASFAYASIPCQGVGAGTVQCDLPSVQAGGFQSFQISLQTDAAATSAGTLSATATMNPGGSSAFQQTVVNLDANLGISQTGPATLDQASSLIYTLSVINNGPNAASNIVITDSFSGPASFSSAFSPDGKFSCSPSGNTVTCTAAGLPAGYSGSLNISLTPTGTGNVVNNASITSATPDSISGNNNAPSAQTTIVTGADLSVTVQVPLAANVGDPVQYFITVHNAGGAEAQSLNLVDTWDSGHLTLTGMSSDLPASCGGGSCTLSQLSVGADWHVTLSAKVTGGNANSTNSAQVTAATSDANLANNTSPPMVTNLRDGADLGIQRGPANPTQAAAGDPLHFSYRITNAGPLSASPVTVTMSLNGSVAGVSAQSSAGSCSFDGNQTVTCIVPSMSAGSAETVDLQLTSQGGNLGIQTSIHGPAGLEDSNGFNNSTSESVTLADGADLSLQRPQPPEGVVYTASGYIAPANGDVTFNYTVTNLGPKGTTNPSFTFALTGAAATIQSASAAGGSCSTAGQQVTCSLPSLAANSGAVSVSVTARVSASAFVTGSARVDETSDPQPNNNSDSFGYSITSGVNLTLTRLPNSPSGLSNGNARLNDDLVFVYNIWNNGPEAAAGITLTDTFTGTGGVAFKSATNASCSSGGTTITCSVGALPAGGSTSVQLTVTPNQTGSVTASAEIQPQSPQSDPNQADNRDSLGFSVVNGTDLHIQAGFIEGLDGANRAIAGTDITFNFTVFNNSSVTAVNSHFLVDFTGSSAGFVIKSGSAFYNPSACTQTGPATLDCSLGDLVYSAAVSVTVTPTSAGPLNGLASVSSSISDYNPSDNDALISVSIVDGGEVSLQYEGDASGGVGSPMAYRIRLLNNGPKPATGISVHETLSLLSGATLSNLAATAANGSCAVTTGGAGYAIDCGFGAFALAAHDSTVISVTLSPTNPGTLRSQVLVTTANDYDTGNNTGSRDFPIGTTADVGVSNAKPTIAVVNVPMTYQYTIKNSGPAQAPNVVFKSVLPPTFTFASVTPSPDCSYVPATRTVTCNLGTLLSSTPAIDVKIVGTPTALGGMHNTYSVSSNATDPNAANNGPFDLATNVVLGADLFGSVTALDYYEVGKSFTYSVQLSNSGPADAANVDVTLSVPSGVSITALSATGATCVTAPAPKCTFPLLAANVPLPSIQVTATAPAAPLLNATLGATLASQSTADQAPDNNSPSKTVSFVRAADMSVVITPMATATYNRNLTYTVQVANVGQGDALDARLTFTPDASRLQFVSTDRPGDCQFAAGQLTCSFGTLAQGSPALVLSVTLKAIQLGDVTSLMKVTTAVPDSAKANDQDSKVTKIVLSNPTVAQPAHADPNPVVTGNRTTLTVLGEDVAFTEAELTYHWTVTGPGLRPVDLDDTSTSHAAQKTAATFHQAGTYHFVVTIANPAGGLVESSTDVVVLQGFGPTEGSIDILPNPGRVKPGNTLTFTATAKDQFGDPLATQPSFTWSASAGGTFADPAIGTLLAGNIPDTYPNAVRAAARGNQRRIDLIVGAINPTVASPAHADPNPVVTGNRTTLTVLGQDEAYAETALTYHWTVSGPGLRPVDLDDTSTSHAAQKTAATFHQAGTYHFVVTIANPTGGSVESSTDVVVLQGFGHGEGSIEVLPDPGEVNATGSRTFTATAKDQFGDALTVQPPFTWNATAGGTFPNSAQGTLVAGNVPGTYPDAVHAAAQENEDTATLIVKPAALTVESPAHADPNPVITGNRTQLSVLGKDTVYDQSQLTYHWVVSGPGLRPVDLDDNGTSLAARLNGATFHQAGTYHFTVTIANPIGSTITSSTDVVVLQGFGNNVGSIEIHPNPGPVDPSKSITFTGTAKDQFGDPLTNQPAFSWSATAGGSFANPAIGTLVAGTTPNTYPKAIHAAAQGNEGTATLIVNAAAPEVDQPAHADPNPVTTGNRTSLSVLGRDNVFGEAPLTYHWVATGPAAVDLDNGGTSHDARNTGATFHQAGTYDFTVTIANPTGATVTSSTQVVVQQGFGPGSGFIKIDQNPVTLNPDEQVTFTAKAYDQFGTALAVQPAFTWTSTAGGAIQATTGLFTAGHTAKGTYADAVQASANGLTDQTTVIVRAQIRRIVVEPDGKTISTSDIQPFTARSYDQTGIEIPGVSYTWQVTGGPGGAISLSGVFRPQPSGISGSQNFTVIATSGSVSGKASLTVVAPSPFASNICNAHAYPVPYKSSDGGVVTFTDLAAGTKIRIFSVDGYLVRRLQSVSGEDVPWDVRNADQQKVSSGVYFYQIEQNGPCAERRGKLVIIQ